MLAEGQSDGDQYAPVVSLSCYKAVGRLLMLVYGPRDVRSAGAGGWASGGGGRAEARPDSEIT